MRDTRREGSGDRDETDDSQSVFKLIRRPARTPNEWLKHKGTADRLQFGRPRDPRTRPRAAWASSVDPPTTQFRGVYGDVLGCSSTPDLLDPPLRQRRAGSIGQPQIAGAAHLAKRHQRITRAKLTRESRTPPQRPAEGLILNLLDDLVLDDHESLARIGSPTLSQSRILARTSGACGETTVSRDTSCPWPR